MSAYLGTAITARAKVAPALLLMAAGLATLFVLGFAQGTMLHELVHDARHLLAFPCH